jgi:hypothetical protein
LLIYSPEKDQHNNWFSMGINNTPDAAIVVEDLVTQWKLIGKARRAVWKEKMGIIHTAKRAKSDTSPPTRSSPSFRSNAVPTSPSASTAVQTFNPRFPSPLLPSAFIGDARVGTPSAVGPQSPPPRLASPGVPNPTTQTPVGDELPQQVQEFLLKFNVDLATRLKIEMIGYKYANSRGVWSEELQKLPLGMKGEQLLELELLMHRYMACSICHSHA